MRIPPSVYQALRPWSDGAVGAVRNAIRALTLEAIDRWLKQQGLNQYGDPQGTMYAGGTPLFDEATGERTDRLDYLLHKFPNHPWAP